MTPQPVPMLGEGCKATWVGASGNQTFIAVDESLVSETTLSACKVFASPQAIGEFIYSDLHWLVMCDLTIISSVSLVVILSLPLPVPRTCCSD